MKSVHFDGLGPCRERKRRVERWYGTEFTEKEHPMAHPATKKRGGDPDVKHTPAHEKPDDAMERKLEEGLEESMAGSDPVSITQPSKSKIDKQHQEKERSH
jgi:hypothetical protein